MSPVWLPSFRPAGFALALVAVLRCRSGASGQPSPGNRSHRRAAAARPPPLLLLLKRRTRNHAGHVALAKCAELAGWSCRSLLALRSDWYWHSSLFPRLAETPCQVHFRFLRAPYQLLQTLSHHLVFLLHQYPSRHTAATTSTAAKLPGGMAPSLSGFAAAHASEVLKHPSPCRKPFSSARRSARSWPVLSALPLSPKYGGLLTIPAAVPTRFAQPPRITL